jgi:hypothetical protein
MPAAIRNITPARDHDDLYWLCSSVLPALLLLLCIGVACDLWRTRRTLEERLVI